MAVDYVKVLTAMSKSFSVIGRGENSANIFKQITDIQPIVGGIENYILNIHLPQIPNSQFYNHLIEFISKNVS